MTKSKRISEMSDIAKRRGGHCLSEIYVSAHKPLKWMCKKGHEFKATYANVSQGKWCRHYSFQKFFHRAEASYKKRRQDDQLKRELCRKNGVALISVPEIPKTLNLKSLPDFISRELYKNAISPPIQDKVFSLDINSFYSSDGSRFLERMRFVAVEKGGRCLATVYLGAREQVQWECREGHKWTAVPDSVFRGTWCPVCAGNVRLTFQIMQDIAIQRGGRCLSESYVNSKTPMRWECKAGHQWEAAGNSIRHGSWCPRCFGFGKSILDMRTFAKIKGGRCLSRRYVSAKNKLKWVCQSKHVWEATPDKVLRGRWCPFCARTSRADKLRFSLEDMQVLAQEEFGGSCLPTKYINARTKLKWECTEGHTWFSTPDNIKRGRGCPGCRRAKFVLKNR